jgi:hypothetical protein
LTDNCKPLYRHYSTVYNENPFSEETKKAGDELVECLTKEKRKQWEELILSIDLTQNSRRAWKTISKLNNDATRATPVSLVTANQVAHQLLLNSKGNGAKIHSPKYKQHPTTNESLLTSFTEDELYIGIQSLKNNKAAGIDNMLVEQIKHFGIKTRKWILDMLNECLKTNSMPKIWRQSRIIAILKPGKDASVPKSYRPISLLCHLYKLYERMILNKIAPTIERHLIDEQAGFRKGKSCTGQLLNVTQYIEDGFEKGFITGSAFVDLSAAYDTVNHRTLIQRLYKMTDDKKLCEIIHGILLNRRYYVELNGDRSRWRNQKNGLPQGSVLSPILFNIYTNDQPVYPGTRSFIYADDLCIANQSKSFTVVELRLEAALNNLTQYYQKSNLRANPEKTQVTAFHLRNREANRELEVCWNNVRLENTKYPKYLGVTLDRTLSYNQHIKNTKMKLSTRNNLIKKLSNSKWGTNPSTIRTTCMAMCYSVAEYACPVWARSSHARKIDTQLNETCRSITGCTKATDTESLYLLAGIAPPEIRRETHARIERRKQTVDNNHQMFGQTAISKRLKSRKNFLRDVPPLPDGITVDNYQLAEWNQRIKDGRKVTVPLQATLSLAKGADEKWTTWRCLNRLRTGAGCSKFNRKRWGFYDGDTTCACGNEDETMKHMLLCPQLTHRCTMEDLMNYNSTADECVQLWRTCV